MRSLTFYDLIVHSEPRVSEGYSVGAVTLSIRVFRASGDHIKQGRKGRDAAAPSMQGLWAAAAF